MDEDGVTPQAEEGRRWSDDDDDDDEVIVVLFDRDVLEKILTTPRDANDDAPDSRDKHHTRSNSNLIMA